MMNDKLLLTVAPSIPPYVAKDIPGLDLSPEGIAAVWEQGHLLPASSDLRLSSMSVPVI